MAATIYSPPEGFDPPVNDFQNFDQYQKLETEWLERLKVWVKENGSGAISGEIIRAPVADGYAQYMVFSVRPLSLIHLPIGDAWHFQWAKNWKATDVKQMVEREKGIKSLFGRS